VVAVEALVVAVEALVVAVEALVVDALKASKAKCEYISI